MATDEDDQGFGIQRKRKREVPRSYRCGGHTTEMATSDASSTSTQWSNNEDRRQSWDASKSLGISLSFVCIILLPIVAKKVLLLTHTTIDQGAGSCTHGQPRKTKQMRSVIPPNNWKFTP
ncbi:hypothetical protein M8C21_003097 [Ambrosia artemisiifolia]|uniref:Uncharacterized protein n=1 Tax=Ambrosia artemisiifolia TaxID=4212 RepID=A0AAD5GU38_AMBAR|nr:hypothetical protein M8C21_003097 [Ambrosia artemisiifolia]